MERILLVEDEAAIAELTAKTLCGLGYEFAGTAWSGREALEAVRRDKPALVLMDIGLPGPMDGIETARLIRIRHDVPVVFLTAASDDHTLERAKAAEPLGYMVKPFEPRNLHAVIEMAFAQHQNAKKRAEVSLRQVEEQFRARFEHAVVGMFQATNDGEFLQANQALARILGYESPEDLAVAAGAVRQVLSVDFDPIQGLAKLCRDPGATKKFELEAYRKDGTTIWVSGNARAVRDAGGDILCYEGSITDITSGGRSQARVP